MDPANPFAAFSLIVAPAILTNASSVLAMSTSNRLARAVDRARDLARQLEAARRSRMTPGVGHRAEFERRLEGAVGHRNANDDAAARPAELLLRARRLRVVHAGGAARCGAGADWPGALVIVLEVAAVGAGTIGVASLVRGSLLLVRETSIAVRVISERAASVRAHARLQ